MYQLMNYSAAEFRDMFERVILPVSNVPNHPLGSVLLDEFLRDFDKPAQRDIWWSIPTHLKINFNAERGCYTEINTSGITLSNDEYYQKISNNCYKPAVKHFLILFLLDSFIFIIPMKIGTHAVVIIYIIVVRIAIIIHVRYVCIIIV